MLAWPLINTNLHKYNKTSHTDHLYRSTSSLYRWAFQITEIKCTISFLYFGKICNLTTSINGPDKFTLLNSQTREVLLYMHIAMNRREHVHVSMFMCVCVNILVFVCLCVCVDYFQFICYVNTHAVKNTVSCIVSCVISVVRIHEIIQQKHECFQICSFHQEFLNRHIVM